LLAPGWEKYAQKPFQVLQEGMVFTIEPRLNMTKGGIAAVEEMVLITKSGVEWLSNPQKK
jgi:Xaa-Pro aminopeptidase